MVEIPSLVAIVLAFNTRGVKQLGPRSRFCQFNNAFLEVHTCSVVTHDDSKLGGGIVHVDGSSSSVQTDVGRLVASRDDHIDRWERPIAQKAEIWASFIRR